MDSMKKYLKLILNIVIPILFLYLICVWGPRVIKFFLPFVIGWVISVIANPLVRFFEKRLKIVRKHSSVLIVVGVLTLIIAALYFLISKLIYETIGFVEHVPQYYEMAWVEIQKFLLSVQGLLKFLPQGMQESVNQFFAHIEQYLNVAVQKIASPTVMAAGSVVKSIPAALVYIIVTIFSSYLFIVDRDKIMEFVHRYIPKGGTRYYSYFKKDVKHLVSGYFLAQFKIMFIIGTVLAVGFLVLGVDYALLLAVIIAFLDFLPILGTGTILIPWALVRMVSGEYAFGLGLVAIYVLTLVLRQIIQPKIVGDTMGLDPLMTLLFLYLGFKISGIAGMILAVPIGMLFLSLYEFGTFDLLLSSVRTLIHDINVFRKEPDKEE
ncbi:sporulation integral membrane protein YtvI [Lacrimispora algidixylanolytica]|uniref:Sporulation integral membrane protein YtvI n=1 Tax=Lacrimispora algidixylanolytica TaxID=94868 RepID=A0A419T140_9FIRM|nr:sporulation integral membrane protein YtvI [Lacrimispora algidixylanolytica]